MKKFFLMILFSFLVLSCSKKVEITGKITNASPLERLEIIEASGVATLPLINMGLNNKGEFKGEFEAPKNGIYAITYAGRMNMIYLKKGQNLNISGNGSDFPENIVISGDAKANNDFLKDAIKATEDYSKKIDVQQIVNKNEVQFVAEAKKIQSDLKKKLEESANKFNADEDVLEFKKDETDARLLGLLDTYESFKSQSGTPYKAGKELTEFRKDLTSQNDKLVSELPAYRDYLLNKMGADFQKFAQSQNPSQDMLMSEMFAKFLASKKELSTLTKDYLMAYVLAQSDINFQNYAKMDKITELIDKNISDSKMKSDLKDLQVALMGHKKGSQPNLKLITKDGKSTNISDLKGKPTLVVFYASWNPNIAVTTVPVLKEVTDYYKSKMNFAYVNLDDTKEQFEKTSSSLLKGFSGTNYWIEAGINADEVKKFGLYGFKLPSYILLDKDGKVSGRPFFNLGDPELVNTLSAVTGIQAPAMSQQMPNLPQTK